MMEREPSSSDEDDDRETLIHQNSTTKPPRRAAFEIGRSAAHFNSRISRCFSGSGKFYVLAALLLPLLFLLVYFVDFRRLLHSTSLLPASPTTSDRMREAELRALYLLRNQQLNLLNFWNLTGSKLSNNAAPSPTSSHTVKLNSSLPISLDELRSMLLEQIKLNKKIQKTLLSSHQSGNGSSEALDDNVGPDLSAFDVDVCRKVEKMQDRRTIEWNPKKNRFLFAICISGQMSNHMICLEKHMFVAALLGRTLIFPSPKFDFQYDKVLDINHINECFGRKVVISFEEFEAAKKNKVRIDRLICYMATPPCFLDEEHIKRLKAQGILLGKIEAAWPEDVKSKIQKKRVADDVTSKFSTNDEVVAVGDMFYADLEEEWVMQPGGPLAHKCRTVLQPSRLIVLTAQRFVQTFLGSNYIALHFRRHGFLKFCNVKENSCFFPIPQAAECILRVVDRSNAPVIYLSTDAARSETDLLQSLVVLNDKAVPLIKRPDHTSVEKWDALLYRNHIGGDNQVEAMLDKTICAMSSVFIGSSGSTFTDDIFRLRRGWGSASQCDEFLCQGELPNFIAELE